MASISLTTLLVDGALVLLLAAVLAAGIRINRRFAEMRKGQAELADLVQRLERSTAQAQEAIGQLKAESQSVREDLEAETRKARALIDELTVITEAGDNLAGRLERQMSARGRDEAARSAGSSGGDGSQKGGRPELLDALKEAR